MGKTTYATLVGTTVHYFHIDEIKESLAGTVKKCEGLLVLTKTGSIEFDHGLGTLTQRILNLTRNEAHVVALYKPEHKLITKAREEGSVLPLGLSYTPGTRGVIELIEGLENENLNIISNFFEDSKTCDQFVEQGYDPAILEKGYNTTFRLIAKRFQKG